VAYPGKAPSRSDSALSTLPLLMYLAMAIGLMVADHRHDFGQAGARQGRAGDATVLVAGLLARRGLFRASTETLATRGQLQADNEKKRHDLQLAIARIHRLNAVADENVRLRRLLGGTRGYALDVRMAGIVDIDLDPVPPAPGARRRPRRRRAGRPGADRLRRRDGPGGGSAAASLDRIARSPIPTMRCRCRSRARALRTIAYGTGRSRSAAACRTSRRART
jgi:rod shape-determining protein MreC